jgi:hypothetical protein
MYSYWDELHRLLDYGRPSWGGYRKLTSDEEMAVCLEIIRLEWRGAPGWERQ